MCRNFLADSSKRQWANEKRCKNYVNFQKNSCKLSKPTLLMECLEGAGVQSRDYVSRGDGENAHFLGGCFQGFMWSSNNATELVMGGSLRGGKAHYKVRPQTSRETFKV